MNPAPPFERQHPGQGPRFSESQLAVVVSVDDPDRRSRVQIRLLSVDGAEDQDAPLWARVATPTAGANRGAFLLPSVDDEVLVSFINGDPRFPVVVGSLWNGAAAAPERLGGDGRAVDRWTLVGKDGSRVAIVEEQTGSATVSLSTPGGVSVVLKEQAGGSVTIEAAGSTITVDPSGVSVQTSAKVSVNASAVDVSAGLVNVDTAQATFTGVVTCMTLQATTVIGTTYTPGAGNVW